LADGSIRIWLNPHLRYARLELWLDWYDEFFYVANFPPLVNPDDPYYLPGDPFPASYLYTVRFPEQTINGVTYKATQLGWGFTFQGNPDYTITIEEKTSSSAIIKVTGIASGGYPIPNMQLRIFNGANLIASQDFEGVVIGQAYELEVEVTGSGSQSVHGEMILTNALGSYEFATETLNFDLG